MSKYATGDEVYLPTCGETKRAGARHTCCFDNVPLLVNVHQTVCHSWAYTSHSQRYDMIRSLRGPAMPHIPPLVYYSILSVHEFRFQEIDVIPLLTGNKHTTSQSFRELLLRPGGVRRIVMSLSVCLSVRSHKSKPAR